MVEDQIAYTYRLHHWWKNRIAQILNRAAIIVLVSSGVLMAVTGLLGHFTFPFGLLILTAVLLGSAGVLEGESVPRPAKAGAAPVGDPAE
jgi:hypothetical protein